MEQKTLALVKPETDTQLQTFYDEAQKLYDYAATRVIATIDDLKLATDDLSVISKLKKAMEEKRKDYLRPFQEHIKEVNDSYKIFMNPIEEADRITRVKMIGYNKERDRLRQEQEEINRLRMEAAQKEMELTGELSESVNLVEVAPEAPKRTHTEMGSAGMRDNWKWEVADFGLIPDEYKMINAGMLTPIIKASKGKITIPGIKIYNEPVIAVNTK